MSYIEHIKNKKQALVNVLIQIHREMTFRIFEAVVLYQ